MESQPEKVYVAIGGDVYDGLLTIRWTLRKWSGQSISIVILHAAQHICKDYIYMPLGKVPASIVSEEKLKIIDKNQDEETDKILSQFIAYCGTVKAEVVKIERNDQLPIYKQIIDMVSRLRITKLVMSLKFMNCSSWKSKGAISASVYVQRQKPDFCVLFVVCEGRLVFLREENNEVVIEDDRGAIIGNFKEKNSIKSWLGKMFMESAANGHSLDSPSSSKSNYSPNQWEKYGESIEQYVNQLLTLTEEDRDANGTLKQAPSELHLDLQENMAVEERIEALKLKISHVQDAIQSNRKEANANKERNLKAEWAISLCTARVEELKKCIDEEVEKNVEFKKEMDIRKEELYELQSEVEEKRNKLNSILELQQELSNRLQLSSSAKSRVEVQLEKAVRTRAEMVHAIEELRGQRDIFQRRIEFCREKDAGARFNLRR